VKILDQSDPRYLRMRVDVAARLVKLNLAAGSFEDAAFHARSAARHAQQLIDKEERV
jgi:2-methylisocitrate lyase-like PEP mutase family enzyme